jgi:hypothetical protein
VRLNRQEFLHKVRDIAGDDAPALRQALKQLAVERRGELMPAGARPPPRHTRRRRSPVVLLYEMPRVAPLWINRPPPPPLQDRTRLAGNRGA